MGLPLDVSHVTMHPLPDGFDKVPEITRLALDLQFNSPIDTISHKPTNIILPRDLRNTVAKPNALHAAGEMDDLMRYFRHNETA